MTTVASILLTLQKYPAQNAPKFAILLEYKSITHCHGIFRAISNFWKSSSWSCFISILVPYLFPLITHHIMINWSDWAIYVCKCNAFKYKHIFVRIFRKMMVGLETESLINGYRFSWNVNFSIISHTYYLVPVSSVHLWY